MERQERKVEEEFVDARWSHTGYMFAYKYLNESWRKAYCILYIRLFLPRRRNRGSSVWLSVHEAGVFSRPCLRKKPLNRITAMLTEILVDVLTILKNPHVVLLIAHLAQSSGLVVIKLDCFRIRDVLYTRTIDI